MTRPQGWLALILALAIGSLLLLRTLPLSLGLDLRGGSQLTLLVKPAGDITRVEAKQLEDQLILPKCDSDDVYVGWCPYTMRAWKAPCRHPTRT